MSDNEIQVHFGNALEVLPTLPRGSAHMVLTSPPYWSMRDYNLIEQEWPDGWVGTLGLEPKVEKYVEHLVAVCKEVRNVLRDDGTFWLNIGDTYISEGTSIMTTQTIAHGNVRNYIQNQTPPNRLPQEDLKERDLALVPFRVALALQKDGWYVRSDIIWFKPNPPESVKSRPTHSHEYVFLLSRAPRYFYDALAIRERSEDGLSHNKKSVWEIPVQPSGGQHYAVFPEKLAEVCILAGTSAYGCCSKCGLPAKRLFERTGKRVFVTTGWETCECKKEFVPCTVLDPFAGSGTALAVARRLGRKAVGIELNKDNLALIRKRSAQRGLC